MGEEEDIIIMFWIFGGWHGGHNNRNLCSCSPYIQQRMNLMGAINSFSDSTEQIFYYCQTPKKINIIVFCFLGVL